MTCDLSTSSLAPVAVFSPISSSAIPPSAPLKSIPIAATSSAPDAMTDGSPDSPSMKSTCATSIHPSTRDEWISSQADSLARIFPPLAKAPESRASGQDSGANSPASFGWYDPATHSLKTAQCSLFADSMSSSPTLPRSGWMRSGRLYPQPRLALPIAGRESGYWQTPVADDAVKWADVMWPTPTVCGNYNRKGASATSGDGLATVVKQFPTPTLRDYTGGAKWANRQRDGNPRPVGDMTLPDVVEANGGSLNPPWVEWLMGWPIGWTALKLLAMGKYQSRPPSPGKC